MLGRRFDEGVDLSGGEWQKIALARAYIRDAQVLILDEPTAALDARAEYEVFLRFSELVAGRMAILISHRFSTVRMADRIIVLRHGKVEEQGSHEELLANGGLYEELFAMQAKGGTSLAPPSDLEQPVSATAAATTPATATIFLTFMNLTPSISVVM